MKSLGFVRQYPYGSKYNINYEDCDTHRAVLEDVKIYKKCGGGSIVENTTCGINRDLKLMYQVSKETGVHVIAGTGHYLGMTQNPGTLKLSVEQMVEIYKREVQVGIDVEISPSETVNIKCGIIGEIGSVYPITEFEKRSILAAAEAQTELKCGVTFHPGKISQRFLIVFIIIPYIGPRSRFARFSLRSDENLSGSWWQCFKVRDVAS